MSTLKTNSIETVTHSDPLVFRTNATETMRLTSDGKLGIGTASPTDRLNIHTASATDNILRFTNTTSGAGGGNGFILGQFSNADCYVWNEEPTNILFATSGVERMRLLSDGRLGLGTSSPIRQLDLTFNSNNSTQDLISVDGIAIRNSNQQSASGNRVVLRFDTSSSQAYTSTIGFAAIHGTSDNNDLWVWSEYWASGLVPSTNTKPIMCFRGSEGNVGINTSTPTAKLQIDGADGTQQGLFVNLNGTDAATVPTTLAEMWTRAPVHIKGAGTSTTRLLIGGDSNGSALQCSNANGVSALPLSLQPFGGGLFHNRLPMYACRAFAKYTLTGTESAGVLVAEKTNNLTFTRSAAGVYVGTFGTAMPDEDYVVVVSAGGLIGAPTVSRDVKIHTNSSTTVTPTASSFTFTTMRDAAGSRDVQNFSVAVFA